MNSGLIAGLAAVSGSIVGAFGSVVGTWITTKHQDLRDLLAKQIVRREALYSDFIAESARLLVDALEFQYQRSSEIDTGLRAPESHST
jgi:hypothetical protein